MSIKDLFDNKGTPKIQKSVTSDEMVENVESSDYVEAKRKQFDRFVPPIDFATASNFAKFGSAELYYEKAFERIHNLYPYDGTLHEKVEFENSSSYLDKYVFENLYPRTNGYVNFDSSSYISIFGGPHTASQGMEGKALDMTFDYSMKYDEEKRRTSAFEFRGEDGITAEFWFKAANHSGTKNIFHVSGASGSGEIKIEQTFASPVSRLVLTLVSGSNTISENLTTIDDLDWNHYAVTINSSSVGLITKSYKNGQLSSQSTSAGGGSNIPHILPTTDSLNMRVGSRFDGQNLLSGSLDEFRFWKKTKTPEEIFNTWFIPVGGGTNKHDSNVDLSLYLKFNEGITGNSSLDGLVLDYSGRINNGTIENYYDGFRSTGSAITEKLSEPEWRDPIIYSSHPDVVSTKAQYITSGSQADLESTSMFISYFPGWMQEEDEQSGKQLKYLSQVLGSYFDTIWHQINFINRIHDDHYVGESSKPLPFAKKLLYDKGFVIPDLFVDATKIENLMGKDDNEIYEKEINEVRNIIYHNIYSNLDTIYKTKGTEKSFRNFFRSVGIGEDVVKLRMYADDSTFVLRNNYHNKSFERKFLNFNTEGHFDATVYQTASANNSNIYIPGDSYYSGSYTLETEVVLPRKNKASQPNYLPYPSVTASVCGFHTSGSDYTHPVTDYDLSVYVIKENTDRQLHPDSSHSIKFMVTGAFGELTSSQFSYQYENNKWNLAVRVKHENYPYANVSGNVAGNYILEFYGVEADGYTKRNSFLVSSSVNSSYFSSDKIFYAGSHKTNFTGSSVHDTDVKLGFLRYWHSYLSNGAIDQHAYDPETFGANEPFESDLVNTYPVEIPREKTLSFHWAFNDLTGSDSSGEMTITDHSSGSTSSNYGLLSDTIQRYVGAKAVGFNASSMNALDKLYLQTARKRLPDDLMSSDLTTIKSDETEQFFVDDNVSDNFYSFEKSMWGTISDEMMNMFSTALDFNNLVGQPNQKYHHRYNMAEFLRDRFFDDVENEPDIEKFTSFYKWIDDSISIAIQQLVPASARFSEKINNIIESHVLERSKYVHQVPILTTFQSTEGSIRGISEMKYDWRFGHAPTSPDNEANHVLWQRDRKEKDGLRETLRNSRNNNSLQSSGITRATVEGSTYLSETYTARRFGKNYDVSLASQETIHGGTNFGRKKNLQLFHESTAPNGRLGAVSGVPQNVITVGVGAGQGTVEEVPNNDVSPRKKKYQLNAMIGNQYGNEYGFNVLAEYVLPLNVMSGTINSGFNAQVERYFKSGSHFTNLHNDIVGNYNETSIQGPFTEQHVGGLQYRHIDINHGSDVEGTRPEGWGLVLRDHPINGPDADGALGFIPADYEIPYPSDAQKATRYRDEHAKRPVNLRNIKTISGSWKVGNYTNEIQIFSLSPEHQKPWALEALNDSSIDILPPTIASALPDTTHYQTLMGISTDFSGNVFGGENDRQPDGGVLSPAVPSITASGSFYVTGAQSPATAASDASFDVYGVSAGPNEGAVLLVTQSNGSVFGYEIDLDHSLVNPTYSSISGATNVDLWDNLSLSLASDLPLHTVSYTNSEDVRSIAISQSAETTSRLYSDSILNGGSALNGSGLALYIYFDTFGDDGEKVVYEALDSANFVSKRISIESGSLNIAVGYKDSVGDRFFDYWEVPNFTSSYSGLNHLAFSHNGSYSTTSGLTFYVNAVSSSITNKAVSLDSFGSPASPVGGIVQNIPTEKIYLFNNRLGGLPLFKNGSSKPIYLDEIVAYKGELLQSHVDDLYNGGKFQSSKPTSPHPFAIYDFEELTVANPIANNDIILDSGTEGNHLTASIAFLEDLVPLTSSGVSSTILVTPATASFLISNAPTGADYNLQLDLQTPYGVFFNLNSALGGYNAGDLGGAQNGDKITFSSGENFILTSSIGSDVGNDYLIRISGRTSSQIWLLLKSKIEANTSHTVTYTDLGDKAFFELTSSALGSLGNNTITTNSSAPYPSYQTLSGIAGGVDAIAAIYSDFDNVIAIPSGSTSERNINTRFSAPGGPEIQTIGYLDAYTQTYSAHNALPWRNLSILGSGSGESGTIRVEDENGLRRGLKTLRTLHQGKFGIDSQYGVITSTSYPSTGSYNKQHRNTSTRHVWSGSSDITASLSEPELITGSAYDNMHISSPIPRSEFQYSWIHASTTGAHWYSEGDAPRQNILGYAPKDGMVSSSIGWTNAIVFPSASSIVGS